MEKIAKVLRVLSREPVLPELRARSDMKCGSHEKIFRCPDTKADISTEACSREVVSDVRYDNNEEIFERIFSDLKYSIPPDILIVCLSHRKIHNLVSNIRAKNADNVNPESSICTLLHLIKDLSEVSQGAYYEEWSNIARSRKDKHCIHYPGLSTARNLSLIYDSIENVLQNVVPKCVSNASQSIKFNAYLAICSR